ncbi:MAG: PAS domain-containing protein [Phycisphaerales bacterium]
MAKKRPSRNEPAKKPAPKQARRGPPVARAKADPALPPRESLRWLLEFAPLVLWAVDERGIFTISEGAGLVGANLRPGEVVGRSVFDMYADVPAVINNVRRALAGEQVVSTLDVRGTMWETRYLPLQGPRGRVRGVLGLSVDVTAREQARTETERSQDRLALIYKRSPVGIIAWDTRFCVRQWNPAAAAIFGIAEKHAIGMHASRIVPPAAIPHVDQVWAELSRASGGERSRNENLTADGRIIICEWYNAPLRDDAGEVVGAVSMVQDVTAEAHAQAELAKRDQELRETSALLNSILDHAPAPIYVTDRDNRYQLVNKAWEAFVGVPRASALGKHLRDLYRPDVAARVAALNEALLAQNRPEASEQLMVGADKTERWFFTVKFPLRDADGTSRALGGISFDISEKKRVEAELARHREHLEQEVQARTQELSEQAEKLRQSERLAALGTLAAGLGHDINNVLLPMRCWVDSLRARATPLGAPAADEISSLTTSLNFLGQLSRSLLTLAASTDDLAKVPARTDVGTWWRQEQAMLRGSLPHPIDLTMTIQPGLPPVRIASDQLTRAMLNLLVNAAEATGPRGDGADGARGGGAITAFARLDGDMVAVGVTDHGPGMTPEVRKHALDPFFTTKKRVLSTGLGLSLVHAVARAAGGSVHITSAPGRGTTVVMRLLRAVHPDRAGDAASTARGDGKAPRLAWVSVTDAHTAGYLLALLSARGFTAARLDGVEAPGATDVWITDPQGLALAQRLARGDRLPWTIVIGRAGPEWKALGARVVSDQTDIEAIAGALP